jgi:hypothetical protein
LSSEDSRRFIDPYWSDALGLVSLNLMVWGYRVDMSRFLFSSTVWSEGKSGWGFMGKITLVGKGSVCGIAVHLLLELSLEIFDIALEREVVALNVADFVQVSDLLFEVGKLLLRFHHG